MQKIYIYSWKPKEKSEQIYYTEFGCEDGEIYYELKFNPNILIDETDIIKPFGNAFEGLNIIHDASKEGKPREKGWPVTGIVSLTENNYVVPLVTNLYSSIMDGHKSINNETSKQLEHIVPNILKEQKNAENKI